MLATLRAYWQMAVVIALFGGSLAVLLFNAYSALVPGRREAEVRERLRQASSRLAAAAVPVINAWSEGPESKKAPKKEKGPRKDWNDELAQITNRILADFPGVEGGFYLGGQFDRFSGYGYPTSPHPILPTTLRTEPPPLEAPFIRLQARESLELPAEEVLTNVRTVGPSRVVVVTQAVGRRRPAPAAVWLLFRLTYPEQLEQQVARYQLANGLGLGGILVALLLTMNMGRRLRRQREQEDRLREELRRSEHLAVLGKLLAGVAHEVRNPLAGIRSTVQLWERLPETARNPDSLHAVVRAVDRLNEIVTRLLYFSRVDNAERQAVPVNSVLTETLDLLEAQAASQSVTVERDLDPNSPSVIGSASALRQVFLNLATNALQAMQRGGRLHCRTRLGPQKHTVEVRFADTGPGISPEDQKHLFEPFFTTRPDGTGLGLALCREIVLQHGGRIEFENGNGATFQVVLPTNR